MGYTIMPEGYDYWKGHYKRQSGDRVTKGLRAAGPTVLVCGHNVGTESFEIASTGALHKKSWAVIDRPYSLGCATVGALYERPGFFVQSPSTGYGRVL